MQDSASSLDPIMSLNYSPGCVWEDVTCYLGPGSRPFLPCLFYGLGITQSQKLKELVSFSFVACHLSTLALLGLYRALVLSCSERAGASISSRSPMLVTVNVTGQSLKHNELSVFWTPPPHQVLRHGCSFPVCIGLWEGFLATSVPVSSTAFPELETTCCWEDVREGQG